MSVKETRMLPLEEFILGNRKTTRKSDVAEEIGLPSSESLPQDISHYLALYFTVSRGAKLVDRAIV